MEYVYLQRKLGTPQLVELAWFSVPSVVIAYFMFALQSRSNGKTCLCSVDLDILLRHRIDLGWAGGNYSSV